MSENDVAILMLGNLPEFLSFQKYNKVILLLKLCKLHTNTCYRYKYLSFYNKCGRHRLDFHLWLLLLNISESEHNGVKRCPGRYWHLLFVVCFYALIKDIKSIQKKLFSVSLTVFMNHYKVLFRFIYMESVVRFIDSILFMFFIVTDLLKMLCKHVMGKNLCILLLDKLTSEMSRAWICYLVTWLYYLIMWLIFHCHGLQSVDTHILRWLIFFRWRSS